MTLLLEFFHCHCHFNGGSKGSPPELRQYTMRIVLGFVDQERHALSTVNRIWKEVLVEFWRMADCDYEGYTEREADAAGNPGALNIDPKEVVNFRERVRALLSKCQEGIDFDLFSVRHSADAPERLFQTRYAQILCELVKAIHDMQDVEYHSQNFMNERDLLVDELRVYLPVLGRLHTAAGRALVTRIQGCIQQAENQDYPLGWCEGCGNPEVDCVCDDVHHRCYYCEENWCSVNDPCRCPGWEAAQMEEGSYGGSDGDEGYSS